MTVHRLSFFPGGSFEDALHILVEGRKGKFIERYCFQLSAGAGLYIISVIVFDHLVEVLQVSDGLQILECELGFTSKHNKTITALKYIENQ